jgi:hypothetical protein
MFEPKFVYQVSRVVMTSEGYTCDKLVNDKVVWRINEAAAAARKFTKGLGKSSERRLC